MYLFDNYILLETWFRISLRFDFSESKLFMYGLLDMYVHNCFCFFVQRKYIRSCSILAVWEDCPDFINTKTGNPN